MLKLRKESNRIRCAILVGSNNTMHYLQKVCPKSTFFLLWDIESIPMHENHVAFACQILSSLEMVFGDALASSHRECVVCLHDCVMGCVAVWQARCSSNFL